MSLCPCVHPDPSITVHTEVVTVPDCAGTTARWDTSTAVSHLDTWTLHLGGTLQCGTPGIEMSAHPVPRCPGAPRGTPRPLVRPADNLINISLSVVLCIMERLKTFDHGTLNCRTKDFHLTRF